MRWLTPDWPDAPASVRALTTVRGGGVSPAPYGDGRGGAGLNLGVHVGDEAGLVGQNRALLREALPADPFWLAQVHGVGVASADVPAATVPAADASVARTRHAVCAVLTADCLPVLFSAADGSVVGAAHAGWRGLAAGVLRRTVATMREAGAADIVAWLGPAIGPRQFEVGAEVMQTFLAGAGDEAEARRITAAFAPVAGRPGKYLADIYVLARNALGSDGVERIAGGEYCTVSDPARFYSYRRDGVTGRQASLIWRI